MIDCYHYAHTMIIFICMTITHIRTNIHTLHTTHIDTLQKSFKQLLDKYKKANADDKVKVARNFFEDKCKIEAMCFNLEVDEEEGLDSQSQVDAVLQAITMDIEKAGGKPFNFRPTFRERETMERQRLKALQLERERLREAEEAEAKRKAQEREQNELEEKRRLDEVARQELEVLEVCYACMHTHAHTHLSR